MGVDGLTSPINFFQSIQAYFSCRGAEHDYIAISVSLVSG